MKIVVIGGTGLIGTNVVRVLTERGHDAVAAAPSTGVDTYTGAGLAQGRHRHGLRPGPRGSHREGQGQGGPGWGAPGGRGGEGGAGAWAERSL